MFLFFFLSLFPSHIILFNITGILCPLLYIFAMFMTEIPVVILLLLLAFMGCLVGGPNNIITSAVAADLADDPSIKGNNKVRTYPYMYINILHTFRFFFSD